MGPERKTIDELLRESRARLDRLAAEDAHAAAHRGALLVDIRSERQREAHGAVPGALCIPRNVLEWPLDPSSGHQDPSVGGLERHVVPMCNEGYQSSLAAATLQTLGFARATDVVGGFLARRRTAGGPRVTSPGSKSAGGRFRQSAAT